MQGSYLKFMNSCVIIIFLLQNLAVCAEDFSSWLPLPTDTKPVTLSRDNVTLHGSKWSFLRSPRENGNTEISALITIEEVAREFSYFGSSWSVWPDPTFPDQGFEAAILFHSSQDGSSGYRVQVSSKYQEIALVRYPDGGYLASVPCKVETRQPLPLKVKVSDGIIRVSVKDLELIRYADRLAPLPVKGYMGVGVSSGAKVQFSQINLKDVFPEPNPILQPHQPRFSTRKWVGGRTWVFDGLEPILLLPSTESNTIMNVKLLPGFKPLLTWNSHWDTQNQGAYPEATNSTMDVQTSGGGESLTATWKGKHTKGRFETKTSMKIGFDSVRGCYTYDHDSELEVLAGNPFHFRYGFDFEHHTPLDPFNWQYLVAKRKGGDLYHRPVYPVDPGPQFDLETYHGQRVWYGRHNKDMKIAPAVEYEIDPSWNPQYMANGKAVARQCNTAVCAAFYDTGVSFPQETSIPGTKVRVKYRYTGYPLEEAKALFEQSKVYTSPMLDPKHHYIFADEWPKLTFSDYVPMSQTWQLGRTPFMTGHNARPSYELIKNCGAGSGFAMKLGPASYGKAPLAKAVNLKKGRYFLSALVRGDNLIGPGGRIELDAVRSKSNTMILQARHYLGNGSFAWKKTGFVFDLPEDNPTLQIAFGNAGTGSFQVTDVEFQRLAEGENPPEGVLPGPNQSPAKMEPSPKGAMADFRMLEGSGHHSLNYAGNGLLETVNLKWVTEEGRPALKFTDNPEGSKDFHPSGYIGMHIFGNAQNFEYLGSYKSYENARTASFAMSDGGGIVLGCERYYLHGAFYRGLIGRTLVINRPLEAAELSLLASDKQLSTLETKADSKGITLAAWIKPDARLGSKNAHPGGGDIIGLGNRRYVLKLQGGNADGNGAPYRLAARLNVNDGVSSEPLLKPGRWYHVAMTATPENGQRRMRLFLDGNLIAEDVTKKWSGD